MAKYRVHLEEISSGGGSGLSDTILGIALFILIIVGLFPIAIAFLFSAIGTLGFTHSEITLEKSAYSGYRDNFDYKEFDFYAIKDNRKHTSIHADLDENLNGLINLPHGKYELVFDIGGTATYLSMKKISGIGEGTYPLVINDPLWVRLRTLDENKNPIQADQVEVTFLNDSQEELLGEIQEVSDGFYVSSFCEENTNIHDVQIRIYKNGYQEFSHTFPAESLQAKTITVTLENDL